MSMKQNRIVAFHLVLLGALSLPVAGATSEPDSGLVAWMGRLQYYVHKLGLAVSAQNRPLQGFYVHEVEEVIEEVEKIEECDGIAIGRLLTANLTPAFEALEQAVEVGDQGRVDTAYDDLLAACNRCHKAANRPYLQIQRRTDNPYLQDFSPAP
jgi:hypothetical protein